MLCPQPIRFENLPRRSCWHENVDEEFKALTIRTYDYNNPAHDNVTCRMAFSPEEENLFELRHDGGYRHDCKNPPIIASFIDTYIIMLISV